MPMVTVCTGCRSLVDAGQGAIRRRHLRRRPSAAWLAQAHLEG
jgi:hypothetical protein